jgi:hypothetical protein
MAVYLGGREAGAGSPLHGSPAARSGPGRREGGRRGDSSPVQPPAAKGNYGERSRACRQRKGVNNVERGAEAGILESATGNGVDPASACHTMGPCGRHRETDHGPGRKQRRKAGFLLFFN